MVKALARAFPWWKQLDEGVRSTLDLAKAKGLNVSRSAERKDNDRWVTVQIDCGRVWDQSPSGWHPEGRSVTTESVAVAAYTLRTKIDLRSGSRTRNVDELETAPVPDADGKLPPYMEFRLEVVVDGLPFGTVVQNKPDEWRKWATARLERHETRLKEQLETRVRQLAERRLGEGAWMVSRVEIGIGSWEVIAYLLVALNAFTNYGAIRQSVDYLHQDFEAYVVPFAKRAAQQVLGLDLSKDDMRTLAPGPAPADQKSGEDREPVAAPIQAGDVGLGHFRINLARSPSL